MQPTKEQEEQWRARFETFGEATVRADLDLRGGVGIGISGPMVEVARAWLSEKERERGEKERERGEKERERERREQLTLTIAKWTLAAALGAVVIGIAGLVATMLAAH